MPSTSLTSSEDEYVVKSDLPPIEIPSITCAEYIFENMKSHTDTIALINASDGSELTYSQWLEQSSRFASSLVALGVTKSDLVLFYADNTLHYAISMLAVILLGNTYSPVTPANGPFELTQQIRDSKGTLLVIDQEKIPVLKHCLAEPEYAETFCNLKLIVVMNCEEVDEELAKVFYPNKIKAYGQVRMQSDAKQLDQVPYFATKQNDHFVIIYTSGTTGLPKGAIHSQYNFLASLLQGRNILLTSSKASPMRMSTWFPIGHASGTIHILNSASLGMTIVLHKDNDLDKLLSAVDKYKSQFLPIPPSYASLLAEGDYHLRYDLSSLRRFSCGGAKVAQVYIDAIKRKFDKDVFVRYGATEFLGSVGGIKYAFDEDKKGNVGRPMAGVEMKIIDLESGKSLPAKQKGEVCFRGLPCFVGYLNNEEATRATIDANGWYHSGDVGYYDTDGCLYIVDRIKELIKYKYWSIAPGEIEDFLCRHPAVADVCVVGVKHVSDGQLARAYVQLNQGKTASAEELIQYVEDNIGSQKRLRGGVRFADQIPRTSIGKIDRKYFRNLIKDELITGVIS